MPKPTIVLVHGAWADASSWNAVASSLQSQEFTVLAPPNPLRGVAADAGYIASFLAQRTAGPVVLVGHSYGGFVITNAATGGGDVRALVYVDAFVPDVGETVFQILGGSGSALDVPDPTTVLDIVGYPGAPEGDAEAFLKPDTVLNSFAQDLPEADRWLIVAGQRPITLSANTTPSVSAGWTTLPSWAVVGTEDRVIPPNTQRHMAQRAGATITEVAGSHVSMVSNPQVAIDAILAAATAVAPDWSRRHEADDVGLLRWPVGDATVLRLGELDATPAFPGLIRELDPTDLSRASWLWPQFVDQAGGLTGLVQVFVVLIAGQVIIVDPGVGNGKRRTAVPAWNDLRTDFLGQLAGAGVAAGQVDYVVNTHLHFDHVGWHTRLVDGVWQPTFPNARYVMSAGEFGYWRGAPQNEIPDQLAGFADSVLPAYEADLVDLVADDHAVIDGVRLLPTPGHTPHHVSVVLESAGQSAVISGDVMHHPCQIAYPLWGAVSDYDPDRARASRADFVDRFADSAVLVIGSHFSDPVAGHIRRDGARFCFVSPG